MRESKEGLKRETEKERHGGSEKYRKRESATTIKGNNRKSEQEKEKGRDGRTEEAGKRENEKKINRENEKEKHNEHEEPRKRN